MMIEDSYLREKEILKTIPQEVQERFFIIFGENNYYNNYQYKLLGLCFIFISGDDYMNINLEKFFPDNFKMTYMHENENLIYIKIKSISKENICPCCGKKSNKVHSTYERNIKDLPIINKKLYITIISKKFFCTNADCERKIFSERFKDFVERYSRRSNRLNLAIEKIFLTNNAETASKIIKSIITYISPSTILRFKESYSTIKLTVKKIKNLCECKGKNKNSIKKISKQNLIKLLCQYYDNLSKNQKNYLRRF